MPTNRTEMTLSVDAQRHDDQLLASIDGIFWEADAQSCQFTYVSEHAERLLGYPLAQWCLPGFWVDHLHPDDRASAIEFRSRAACGYCNHSLEYRMIAVDGQIVWLQDIVRGVVEGDRVAKQRGILLDVTERRQAEAERLAQLWFLESMDKVNRAMQGANDLEQMMSAVLDAVLAIFACDRGLLLYSCDPQASSWRVAMERTRPAYPSALAWGLEEATESDILNVFQIVRAASGPVKFGRGEEHQLPVEATLEHSVQSMIAMAVYPKVDKPYMFALHQCSHPRTWTPQEERLFQEIGRRLGDALTSLLVYRNLQESELR